ncbi:MAG: DinB family protein [Dehalococcoidia bacterium]
MSGLRQIRALYDYNEWANNHNLDAVSALSDAERTRPMGASFGSVQDNLWHVVSAQTVWHDRFAGKPARPLQGGNSSLDDLRAAFAASHENLRSYVASLTENDLSSVLRYTDTNGNARQIVLWQPLLHLVNHGTHHRAETALIVTSLGKPMRELDYVFFELERS